MERWHAMGKGGLTCAVFCAGPWKAGPGAGAPSLGHIRFATVGVFANYPPPMSSLPKPTRERPILAVTKLTLQRGRTTILRDLSWEVRRGEHWVILGNNGSGKTSLLLALTGYALPTGGEIDLLGERFGESDWRKLRERVGIVSSAVKQRVPGDELALDTVISGGRAMIGFWGKPTEEEREAAEKWLRQARCFHLAAREWRVLSQGERQRVLIARALMGNPALLILDEPCEGLDPVAREQFLHFLQQLANRPSGPSLVLVTHHVEEIMPAFSHALLLKQGRVAASGAKAKVLTSEQMSAAFAAEVRVTSRIGRYRLTLSPKARGLL